MNRIFILDGTAVRHPSPLTCSEYTRSDFTADGAFTAASPPKSTGLFRSAYTSVDAFLCHMSAISRAVSSTTISALCSAPSFTTATIPAKLSHLSVFMTFFLCDDMLIFTPPDTISTVFIPLE